MADKRLGTCHLCLDWETNAFSTLSIVIFDQVLLTPNAMDAQVLHWALTMLSEKGIKDGGQLVHDSLYKFREHGSTWVKILPHYTGEPRKVLLATSAIAIFVEWTKLKEVLADMNAVLEWARSIQSSQKGQVEVLPSKCLV